MAALDIGDIKRAEVINAIIAWALYQRGTTIMAVNQFKIMLNQKY